jgi:LysR family transcriptional regulator, glycine cleavage system transcriptional activator
VKRGEIPSVGGLTSFVAAAQHGSFTRAAGELNLTQGAVSRQIRDIESHLGIRLFERIRQRVVLTEAGKFYLSQVKKALEDLADATQQVAAYCNSTTLNIVAPPTFAAHWLVPRLSEFQNRNPAIMVRLTTRQSPMDFATEPFDAAVFHGSPHLPGTISHFLMEQHIIAVCSPRLNASRAIRTAADVVKYPLLHKIGKPGRWIEWMAKAGVMMDGPLPGHAYQSFAMIAQAAMAGLGIALVPRYLIEDELADKRLEIVASEFVDMRASYYLFLPEARAGASVVQAFAKWLMADTTIRDSGRGHLTSKKAAIRRPVGRDKILLEHNGAAQPRTAG